MKLLLLTVGPTDAPSLRDQIETYAGRLGRYIPFEMESVPDVRSRGGLDPSVLKAREAEQLLRRLQPHDTVWILDENGKQFSSRGFAGHLQKCMNAGPKRLVLLIGGAYGFAPAIRQRALSRGWSLNEYALTAEKEGAESVPPIDDEAELYRALHLDFMPSSFVK